MQSENLLESLNVFASSNLRQTQSKVERVFFSQLRGSQRILYPFKNHLSLYECTITLNWYAPSSTRSCSPCCLQMCKSLQNPPTAPKCHRRISLKCLRPQLATFCFRLEIRQFQTCKKKTVCPVLWKQRKLETQVNFQIMHSK